MRRWDILKKRQARLSEDIAAMLDSSSIGTVSKSPSMTGYSLTTKVEGKTVNVRTFERTLFRRRWRWAGVTGGSGCLSRPSPR